MNYYQYKAAILGHPIDLDHYPAGQPFQCVDLVSDYAIKVCAAPSKFNGNARDLAGQVRDGLFTWVLNEPGNLNQFPPVGAIVVYGGAWGGGFGHTGIVDHADGVSVVLLEQNSPEPFVAIHTHGYNGMLGWLIPRVEVAGTPAVFSVRCVVNLLYVRAAPTLSSLAGQANRQIFPDGNLHNGNTADCILVVAGDWYTIGGVRSNLWYKTVNGHYFAAGGAVHV
jgi:hypothetical protein